MSTITINESQQVFCIPCGGGYTTRGFRSLFVELGAILGKLGRADARADESKLGTIEQYQAYSDAIKALSNIGGFKETWFNPQTPEAVRRVIESARKSGTELRIYNGDTETGRDWGEENDVMGRIGRSGGLLKVPLLLADGESGGMALLDHCIVKIQRVSDGKVLYQHEKYQAPTLSIRPIEGVLEGTSKRYRFEVLRDGDVLARFPTDGAAYAYMAFMLGTSFTQPSS